MDTAEADEERSEEARSWRDWTGSGTLYSGLARLNHVQVGHVGTHVHIVQVGQVGTFVQVGQVGTHVQVGQVGTPVQVGQVGTHV